MIILSTKNSFQCRRSNTIIIKLNHRNMIVTTLLTYTLHDILISMVIKYWTEEYIYIYFLARVILCVIMLLVMVLMYTAKCGQSIVYSPIQH